MFSGTLVLKLKFLDVNVKFLLNPIYGRITVSIFSLPGRTWSTSCPSAGAFQIRDIFNNWLHRKYRKLESKFSGHNVEVLLHPFIVELQSQWFQLAGKRVVSYHFH